MIVPHEGDRDLRAVEAGRDARGHSLAADLASEQGLAAFVRGVGEALDVSLVDVWLFVPDREALVYEAVWRRGGHGGEAAGAIGTWVALDERPDLKSVIESAAPVERHVDDPALPAALRAFLESRGYRSVFDAPLRAAGETVGVLGVVETRGVRRFSEHDRELLARLCELAARGAQTAWAQRREAERESHLDLLLEASRNLAGSLDHREALDRVISAVDGMLAGMDHETVVYLRREDGSFAPANGAGAGAAAGGAAPAAPAVTIDGEPDALALRSLGRGRPAQARTGGVPTRLVVPLIAAGEPQGFVDIRGRPLRRFATDETMLLQVLADQTAAAFTHEKAGRAAGRQAAVDTMTGFFNRWYFYDRLFSETARAYRYKQPLSVVLVGVDRFEEYLHRRGRTDANAVLKAIARLLTASLRNKVDIACVHTDGEFGLLLPNTPPFKPGAALVGQRLRRAVEGMEFRDEDHATLGRFTVSIGVAGYPRHADDADELGGLAVGALAEARALGGNRVHVHGAPPAAYGPESEDDEEPPARGGETADASEDPIAALIRPPDWDDHIDEDDLPLTADHTGLGNDRADRRRQANLGAAPGIAGPGTQRPSGIRHREAAVEWREDDET